MEKSPFGQLAKGSFLVASPDIEEGIFFRSIVILCEHSLSGSFGLILNKNIEFEDGEYLIEVEDLANPNVELLAGGPLQMNQMMVIHSQSSDNSIKLLDHVYLGGDLEFLQNTLLDEQGPAVRLIFGYTSWSSGQLEKEFLNGQWFVCPGSFKHVFETNPETMWQSVLKEMGGKYASLSMIPEDLTLN
ncbi:MAG: hypothetical protein S4CHLAM7_01500 [Chlamydiae bacterium]|nr:hypothetical protein [Chlamydiota bacterium]